MQVFNLIYKDGSGGETNHARTLSGIEGVIRAIRAGNVETIVVGEIEDGNVLWERQFSEVTVMPSDFGKRS